MLFFWFRCSEFARLRSRFLSNRLRAPAQSWKDARGVSLPPIQLVRLIESVGVVRCIRGRVNSCLYLFSRFHSAAAFRPRPRLPALTGVITDQTLLPEVGNLHVGHWLRLR